MKTILLIFTGGGAGSLLRFFISKWVNHHVTNQFPAGTLLVNMLACFFVGLLIGLAEYKNILSTDMSVFWIAGFCGGFSTFSAFSYESVRLGQTNQYFMMMIYVAVSITFCMVLLLAGLYVAKRLAG